MNNTQHSVHPNATKIINEHRKLVRDRRNVVKDDSLTPENKKSELKWLDRAISFAGQVFNHRISAKSRTAINLLG
jgi:hypothetical protein